MYNSNKPNLDELPSSAKLLKSTILAAIAAIVILVTIILPAEYGVDPTRIGKMLGLAEMGEIKVQLHAEAEADRQSESQQKEGSGDQSSLMNRIVSLFVRTASAKTTLAAWTDEISIALAPGKGVEVKLVMEKNATAEFTWIASGGVVNYDLHGDGSGQKISYKKGRAVPGHKGVLKAAFTGNHGWFWRNRDKQEVTVTLFVRGAYSKIKRPD